MSVAGRTATGKTGLICPDQNLANCTLVLASTSDVVQHRPVLAIFDLDVLLWLSIGGNAPEMRPAGLFGLWPTTRKVAKPELIKDPLTSRGKANGNRQQG